MSTRNPMYQAVISSCEGSKGGNVRRAEGEGPGKVSHAVATWQRWAGGRFPQ